MPIEILMPALSPTMTEGKLAKWHKSVGEEVAAGDVLAEIETDKATMEGEAVEEGRLGKILIDEGTDNVAVNTPIAVLLEEGEDEAALDRAGAPAAAPVQAPAPAEPAAPAVSAPAEAAPTAETEWDGPTVKLTVRASGRVIHTLACCLPTHTCR